MECQPQRLPFAHLRADFLCDGIILRATVEYLAAATANGNPAIVRMSLDRGGHAIFFDGGYRNGSGVSSTVLHPRG